MNSSIIDIKNLTIFYENQLVLNNINISIKQDDFIVVIGANGSGKTTLVRSILGLIRPQKGMIQYQKDIQIGYLPQRLHLQDKFFPATVQEVVATGLLIQKRFPRFIRTNDYIVIDETMKMMGIYDIKDAKIGDLSGGQQQRVMLARMLVSHPKVLVLDEPTNALDESIRKILNQLLSDLHKKGTTILMVTHDLSAITQDVTRIIELDKAIIFDGQLADYCRNRSLLSRMNPQDTLIKGCDDYE